MVIETKYLRVDDYGTVTFKNGVELGTVDMLEDGDYYFYLGEGRSVGAIPGYLLTDLGELLEILNKKNREAMEKYFRERHELDTDYFSDSNCPGCSCKGDC